MKYPVVIMSTEYRGKREESGSCLWNGLDKPKEIAKCLEPGASRMWVRCVIPVASCLDGSSWNRVRGLISLRIEADSSITRIEFHDNQIFLSQ